MAQVVGGWGPLDFRLFDLTPMTNVARAYEDDHFYQVGLPKFANGTTSTSYLGVIYSAGIKYDGGGNPISGSVWQFNIQDGMAYAWAPIVIDKQFSTVSVGDFLDTIRTEGSLAALISILDENDQIIGTKYSDYVYGGAGQDTVKTMAADDTIIGGQDNDMIDGGDGIDTAKYLGLSTRYDINHDASGWYVLDLGGSDGQDRFVSIEKLEFDNRTVDFTTVQALEAAAHNLFQITGASFGVQVANGFITVDMALSGIDSVKAVTTSVATLAYQFFTGSTPTAAGMKYLVSPEGSNPNNLSSAYYSKFGLENRYINFAVNLGKLGAGHDSFEAEYGSLSLAGATGKAYAEIFGSVPTAEKITALLSGGRDAYFAAYGQDGPQGLGTKAAMVGWLLAEAEKADVGLYARANDALLADVVHSADGGPTPFGVDMIGVYGKPEYDYLGG